LTSIKNLQEAGITDIVCYEKNNQIGGNWVFTAGESHSSVCETTHIISSKALSAFEGFPMPDHYPDYPSHKQVLEYFQAYAKAFNLAQYIQFNTSVVNAEELQDRRWHLTLSDGTERTFDYLFVANGHHSVPRWPDIEGTFEGEYVHSHSFKSNTPFTGKRVLVIGAGNSGCDCAVEASRVAAHTAISLRRPTYIIPKFLMGKPTDTYNALLQKIPRMLRATIQKLSLQLQIGKYERYGLSTPDYPITACHPTLNSELLYKIRHGRVTPKSGVVRFEGKTVHFADGSHGEFDTVIAATGYKIAFPFFKPGLFNFEDAFRIPLYLRMLSADHPSVFFIGLVQPQGCIWPLSDLQAQLAALHVKGDWLLPKNLSQLAEAECDEIDQEFQQAHRHSLEVHFHPFAKKIRAEITSASGMRSAAPV
ncbi:MAG: NAD(P)-binding domain-containing protein, partial [Mameliella sp.]|nr:NAD(P)-binding domain-containing protein [Phaeodactylibacter sp.]